jgi:kinesin family protein C2/C3
MTGTGKSHTMQGPPSNVGVNIRALTELFERSEARKGEWHDEISLSMMEVYNEALKVQHGMRVHP